jgi:hypothetical protein
LFFLASAGRRTRVGKKGKGRELAQKYSTWVPDSSKRGKISSAVAAGQAKLRYMAIGYGKVETVGENVRSVGDEGRRRRSQARAQAKPTTNGKGSFTHYLHTL